MPTALITGGAGFIGSHLCEQLVWDGYSVRVLDNFTSGRKENLAGCLQEIEFIQGDIRDPQAVLKSVQGVEFIFHLAAQISVVESMKDPAGCFDVNVNGTNLLLQTAAEYGVKKVVISSSAAVYGNQDQLPIAEINPLFPLSPYAASKQIDEILAGLYSRSYHLPVICLRYFNVFGPRQNPNSPYAAAIPIFIRRLLDGKAPVIYGDGGQTRDFIFVTDVARANILAAKSNLDGGVIMNICTGKQVSILDLVMELQRLISGPPTIQNLSARIGDIYHSYGNPRKAMDLISFTPEVDFIEGLTRTIEWMKL